MVLKVLEGRLTNGATSPQPRHSTSKMPLEANSGTLTPQYAKSQPKWSSPPRIRAAEPKDAPAIVKIGSEVFSATFGYSLSPQDLAAYLQDAYNLPSIAGEIADPLKNIVVACDKHERVVGFSQLTQGTIEECVATAEKPIELQRLYIDQEYHGSGIGKALVVQVERTAREMGFKTMWLGVWEENFKAQKVYEKMGYVRIGEHDFKMGDCVQKDFIMIKEL